MFILPTSRSRGRRRIIAGVLAYLLALQGLIASVGLGMSAASAADGIGFVLCSPVTDARPAAPLDSGSQDRSDHRPQCPFCFVAAQSAGFLATPGDATIVPADVAREVSALRYGTTGGRIIASSLRRSNGHPRAPPSFSV